ncbi:MAG: class I adenylate-forming enzyme family protein [Acidimicrobiia bacterium]
MIDNGAEQIWPLFEARVSATPGALAVVDETGAELTWGQLSGRVAAIARGLERMGVGRGSTVSWQLPTCIDAMTLALALCRLGVVQNPIIPMYQVRELRLVLSQVKPSLVFIDVDASGSPVHGPVQEALTGWSDGVIPRIVTLADLDLSEGDVPPPTPIHAGDRAWYCYTSGSTSAPKGAIHTDMAPLTAGRVFADAMELTPDDRYAIVFPFAHIGGMCNVVSSLVSGMVLYATRKFDPEVTIPALEEFGHTIAGAGPPFFSMYLEKQRQMPAGVSMAPTLRALAGGGAPTPPRLHTGFDEQPGSLPICISYGLTEVPIATAASPWDPLEVRSTTVGRPWRGMEIRVVDGDGNDVSIGVDGEVLLRGPQMLLGYLDESLNAAAFTDGWFRTGDLGHLTGDGYLSIVGRIKDVIIRNMENIAPSEVEDLLIHHAKVREASVIGLPDERTGERVCAVVVPRDPSLTLVELTQWARAEGLTPQKLPTQLELVDELPLIGYGKVDKKALRDRFSGH